MRRLFPGVVLLTVACAVPYVPEPVDHPLPIPAGAFDRVVDVCREYYRRLETVDRDGFRVRSAWHPFERNTVPGDRRASVFLGPDGRLRVVVEVRYVKLGWTGPVRTGISGDRRLEQELAGALERALVASGPSN